MTVCFQLTEPISGLRWATRSLFGATSSRRVVGNGLYVVRLLVSRFSFPIRNLVTKCDLRCLVGLQYGAYVFASLVGLTHPCRRLLRHMVQSC